MDLNLPDSMPYLLKEAIRDANQRERETGVRQYVMMTKVPGGPVVMTEMPLLGEWYDADGIRHG